MTEPYKPFEGWDEEMRKRNEEAARKTGQGVIVFRLDEQNPKEIVAKLMTEAKKNKLAFPEHFVPMFMRAEDTPLEIHVIDVFLGRVSEGAAKYLKTPPRMKDQPGRKEAIVVQSFIGRERTRYHLYQYYRQEGKSVHWLGEPEEGRDNGTPQE